MTPFHHIASLSSRVVTSCTISYRLLLSRIKSSVACRGSGSFLSSTITKQFGTKNGSAIRRPSN